jgi:CubicO group peptidase (beta-lactamase class C family)
MMRSLTALAPALLFLTAPAGAQSHWTVPGNDQIQQLLVEQLTPIGTGAVVGVIEPGGQRVVTWGRSGAASGRPLDQHTVFMIASLTKVFTSLILADMVTRGEVGLEDPVSKYLPSGVRMPQRGRPITLVDLSRHWSGLPSMPTNFALDGTPNPYSALTEKEFYAFLSSYELPHEPGIPVYSNVGVSLLGKVLARRAGTDYESLLTQRVLSPLGLNSTSITLTPDQQARLAPGHDRYGDPVDSWDLLTMPASGGLRSTVHDLLQFLQYNISLDTPLRSAMELQRAPSRSLGWGRSMLGGEAVYQHEGGKEGYQSAMIFNPARGTGVVLLLNGRSGASPMTLARQLLYSVAPLPAPAPKPGKPVFARLDRMLLDQYSGTYQGDSLGTVRVARKDDHLFVNPLGGGILVMWPISKTEFISKTVEVKAEFDREGLRFWNGITSLTARKLR